MRTIDHRILIPATPERVWEVVSDISRNPDWQLDCTDVIFLTSKRSGPGLRWRFSGGGHREFVYEVSAWYEGFGYEYYFVDGPTFRDARGRIRLQEVPEGTIVQWTFSYETGGMLGGMRSSLGLHNSIDHLMQDSLRRLWQMLKSEKRPTDEVPSKSLMQDAPNVEERTAYQPRHSSKERAADASQAAVRKPESPTPRAVPPADPMPAAPPSRPRPAQPLEPAIMHEDTRPNRAATTDGFVAEEETIVPADFPAEPSFLSDLEEMSRFEPPVTSAETQPRAVRVPQEPTEPEPVAQTGQETQAPEEVVQIEPPPAVDAAPVSAEPAPRSAEPAPGALAEPPVSSEDTPARPMPAVRAPEPEHPTEPDPVRPTVEDSRPEPMATIGDTRSIWEIFNVPRPTDAGETAAVTRPSDPPAVAETTRPAAPVARPPLDTAPAVPYALDAGTRGLRQSMRRRIVRLRRLG